MQREPKTCIRWTSSNRLPRAKSKTLPPPSPSWTSMHAFSPCTCTLKKSNREPVTSGGWKQASWRAISVGKIERRHRSTFSPRRSGTKVTRTALSPLLKLISTPEIESLGGEGRWNSPLGSGPLPSPKLQPYSPLSHPTAPEKGVLSRRFTRPRPKGEFSPIMDRPGPLHRNLFSRFDAPK